MVTIAELPGMEAFHRIKDGTFCLTKSWFCRVRKGPGVVFKGRGCCWGTLRIPFGKIGEP